MEFASSSRNCPTWTRARIDVSTTDPSKQHYKLKFHSPSLHNCLSVTKEEQNKTLHPEKSKKRHFQAFQITRRRRTRPK